LLFLILALCLSISLICWLFVSESPIKPANDRTGS
jgi:hypothetical protein